MDINNLCLKSDFSDEERVKFHNLQTQPDSLYSKKARGVFIQSRALSYICIGRFLSVYLFCFVLVLQRSGGSCYLSSLSTMSMFIYDLSRTLPEVFVSRFGYFRV